MTTETGTRYVIQLSEFVDHVTEDGRELTQLPKPFFVDGEGYVGRQDFWKGNPFQIIGFQEDLDEMQIDLTWEEAISAPEQAVGMYLVAADERGDFGTYEIAVASVTVAAS